jgi:hypothetical protein
MAHTYILFDFGADEDKAQQARHKLEGWKQAFRLDKKLQFKFDRTEAESAEAAASTEKTEKEKAEKTAKTAKPKAKAKGKAAAEAAEGDDGQAASASNGSVKLLVRLYFSPHEKLSEQRWLQRIPTEEPFKGAAPKVVQEGQTGFPEALAQFDRLD